MPDVIDRARCMAPKDRKVLGGPRCQEPATHDSLTGRLCSPHAEEMHQILRNPNTLGNVITGGPCTEEQIAKLVVELPS